MESSKYYVLLLTVFVSVSLSAQKSDNLMLSVNYGVKDFSSELNEAWPIRQNIGTSINEFNRNVILGAMMNYVGVSSEYFFLNKKLSFVSGLRFTFFNSEIIKSDYANQGYFFLRFNSDGFVTEFVKIKAIKENTNYFGVPLALKYMPFNWSRVSLYVKLSAEIAYKISSSTDIDFKNDAMANHRDEVLKNIKVNRNNLYSSIYSSVGARFRLGRKTYCSVDAFFPAFYMTENNSGLVKINSLSGMQLSLDVAL